MFSEFREYLYRYLPELGEGWVIRVKGSGKLNWLTDFIAEVFFFGFALTMVARIHSQDALQGMKQMPWGYPTRCRYRVPCSVWHVKQEFQHQKNKNNWFAAYTDIVVHEIFLLIWFYMNLYDLIWIDMSYDLILTFPRGVNIPGFPGIGFLGCQVSRSMRLLKDWSPFTSSPSCTSKRLWCCLTQRSKTELKGIPVGYEIDVRVTFL